MSDENTNGAVAPNATDAAGPAFTVEKIYVKDVSFEVPGAPAIFGENVQPELQLNLNQRVQRLNENMFEVVLGVTLTCKAGDKTAYVAEVQQAGVFGLVGLEPQAIDVLLGTQCPNILFPYVRQLISDLVQAGGFRRSSCSRSTSTRCTPRPCASARSRAANWPTRNRPATPDRRAARSRHGASRRQG